ncbi:MAG: ABC transporter permease, partial [Anaerolineales bacterium]|nr:ABC transporter permease [Anaerolineales bacterium]
RAKGLSAWLIIMRHALKNALIPIVTTLGVTLGHLIGGTVLIETVFNIPGMGRMIVESIWRSEFFVMQGSILVVGVIVAVLNLIVDVLYTWLDPRIRVDR